MFSYFRLSTAAADAQAGAVCSVLERGDVLGM